MYINIIRKRSMNGHFAILELAVFITKCFTKGLITPNTNERVGMPSTPLMYPSEHKFA